MVPLAPVTTHSVAVGQLTSLTPDPTRNGVHVEALPNGSTDA
jgi:hypothetical protein